MAPTRRDLLRLTASLPLLPAFSGLARLGVGAASLAACRASAPDPITERALGEELYRKGARWLWRQQHDDGAFRSGVYGLMASGQSMTPFVLTCMTDRPRDDFDFPRSKALKGLEFLDSRVARNGAVGFSSDAPDYPVYATALTIRAYLRLRPPRFGDRTAPMVAWLRRQQMSARNGWEGHPGQGGFPMGTWDPVTPPDPPHVDLSMTRVAVQALASLGVHANDRAMVEARGFVERCSQPDGSFVYSPVHEALNKGQGNAGYGSATADALAVLVANRWSDEALSPHVAILRAMHRVDVNPRIGDGPRSQYADAMRFYYRAGSASVFEWTGGPTGWADELVRALAEEQGSDGSWRNAAPAQREDDPLVATSLALSALGCALRSWPRAEGGPRL